MRLTHHPWLRRLLRLGANTDVRPELLQDGLYRDAKNVRPASVDGNTGSVEAVKGESLVYGPVGPNPTTYTLIGSAYSNGYTVEFWASSEPDDNAPIVRVNGTVMATSPNIPYVYNRPLQIAVVEQCRSGILYPADHFSDPLFWDIDSLVQNFNDNTGTYFGGYTTAINSVGLSASPEFPVHTALPNVGTGLPAGQYQYWLRYVTPQGDRTNFGPETPLISVPRVQSVAIPNAYPGGQTTGGPADLLAPTPYGIELRFRIDNLMGYAEVEVCRRRFNDGQGLNGPGIVEVVARIEIEPGQFSPEYVFIDPVDANVTELIPSDEVPAEQLSIKAPKAVEYADGRLSYGNFTIDSRVAELAFRSSGGETTGFITQRVTTFTPTGEVNDGYSNPVNNTYLKSFARGERYGLGILPWDSNSGKAFVIPVTGAEDLQFPNHRDVKQGDDRTYSSDDINAANVNVQSTEPVSPTYDTISQGSYRKDDGEPYINVMTSTNVPYRPWRPTSPSATQTDGYGVNPVSSRILSPTTVASDTGNIWSPTYHALGALIYGVENIPSWLKAFTVMRTAPAGRVVMSGIGVYKLSANPVSQLLPANKSINEVWFFSRDADAGLVDQATLEDIETNPQNYRIQVVSPRGFYSEQYGYYVPPAPPTFVNSAFGTDQLTYAGVLHDEGQVNVGEPPAGGMGISPGPTSTSPDGNYVTWGIYRSSTNGPNLPWFTAGNDGNTLLNIDAFTATSDSSRSRYWSLKTDGFIYSYQSTNDDTGFQDTNVRNFHEPFYIINIIRLGAEVPDLNTQQYVSTGLTVKMESVIGISTGSGVQSFKLLNERLDDCRGYLNTDYRYVYVRTPGQLERAWVCLTNNTTLPVATVLADIAANGFWVAPDGTNVYGIYEAYIAGPTGNLTQGQPYVVFGGLGTGVPPANSRIVVKYNPLAPLRVFGGDRTIAPCIFSPLDRVFNASGDITAMPLGGLPLPYPGWVKNGNYLLPDTGTELQDEGVVLRNISLRQWCVMWDSETLAPGNLDLFSAATEQAFPRIHYVIHPYRDINYTSGAANGFLPQYDVDYPGEGPYMSMGGLRFLSNYNLDYSKKPLVSGIGLPQSGYVEKTDYCASIAASELFDPLQQDVPGLRSFFRENMISLSEECGEIKVIASALGPNGRNMWAWTQRGVCMVLTNKNILTGADGAEVATQSISNYWGTQIWKDRTIGCPDQFWRLFAKGSMPTRAGYADSFTWPDRSGWYQLTGGALVDISRNRYLSRLLPILKNLPTDYTPQMSAFYNAKFKEVWNSIQYGNPDQTNAVFVYSPLNDEWIGEYSYAFDGYLQRATDVLGFRDLETYLLDEEYTINGATREAWVEVPMVPALGKYSEAIRFRVVGTKPDAIELYDKDKVLMCRMDATINNSPLWVKRYDSWEGFISRTSVDYDTQRRLAQDEYFYLRALWNTEGDKQAVALELQNKQIK